MTYLKFFPWAKGQRYSSLPGGTSPSRSSFDKNSEDGLLEKAATFRPTQKPVWQSKRFLGAHLALFAIYLAGLSLALTSRAKSKRDYGLPVSPAVEAVQYEDTIFKLEGFIQEGGKFAGKPSAELDKAWHDLLNDENIIIETEYMRHYGRENIGVAVPEGGGFIGTLNVYHELHCLKRIHQFMYSDYYFKDFTPRQHELNRMHNEHCIDFLRMSAMCHGDIGLITYEWHDDSLIPVANATSHQCINWDKLVDWTKARTVNMMKPGWLVHPMKGVAYPHGTGDKLGAVDNQPHLSHGGHGH